ncbi:hypothetical protein D3C72_2150380 [compost metagenome]
MLPLVERSTVYCPEFFSAVCIVAMSGCGAAASNKIRPFFSVTSIIVDRLLFCRLRSPAIGVMLMVYRCTPTGCAVVLKLMLPV